LSIPNKFFDERQSGSPGRYVFRSQMEIESSHNL
jgi:hypothetical protein